MNLRLERQQLAPDFTLGELFVDGEHECYVCEDTVRPDGAPKVYGKTAIPVGTYTVDVTYSNRFKRDMPILLDVPGFKGIRIHWGNDAADTDGCLLVGCDRLRGAVGRSRDAFATLYPKIVVAKQGKEQITIEVVRGDSA